MTKVLVFGQRQQNIFYLHLKVRPLERNNSGKQRTELVLSNNIQTKRRRDQTNYSKIFPSSLFYTVSFSSVTYEGKTLQKEKQDMVVKSHIAGWLNVIAFSCVVTSAPILSYVVPESHVFSAYFITSLLFGILNYTDTLIYDNFSKNYKIIKDTGLSELEIWSSALLMIFGFQVPGVLMLKYIFGHTHSDWITLTWEEHFPIHKILICIVTVWLTDSCFCLFHKLLHERFARIHLLHHCCVYSSMSSNVFIHPLDLAMEFTAPVCTVCVISYYAFNNDSWMFILQLMIMQNWYALSHDLLIHTEHINHHRHCSPGYFIYHNIFYSNPQMENVRYGISEFQKKKNQQGMVFQEQQKAQ